MAAGAEQRKESDTEVGFAVGIVKKRAEHSN
jgi:hypothetical protein